MQKNIAKSEEDQGLVMIPIAGVVVDGKNGEPSIQFNEAGKHSLSQSPAGVLYGSRFRPQTPQQHIASWHRQFCEKEGRCKCIPYFLTAGIRPERGSRKGEWRPYYVLKKTTRTSYPDFRCSKNLIFFQVKGPTASGLEIVEARVDIKEKIERPGDHFVIELPGRRFGISNSTYYGKREGKFIGKITEFIYRKVRLQKDVSTVV